MLTWLKRLFSRKVAAPTVLEPYPDVPLPETVAERIIRVLHEEEANLRDRADQSESAALRVKLHARADSTRDARLIVEDAFTEV